MHALMASVFRTHADKLRAWWRAVRKERELVRQRLEQRFVSSLLMELSSRPGVPLEPRKLNSVLPGAGTRPGALTGIKWRDKPPLAS